MSSSSSLSGSSSSNTIESLGNLDVEEYATWSTDEQVAYVESYLTENCSTEEEKAALRDQISEEVDVLLLKCKTQLKELEDIAGDETADSQTRVSAETLMEALDSVEASLESLTDEVWDEAIGRQEILSVDMTDKTSEIISIDDAKDGDTITVYDEAVAGSSGSTGIFSESAYSTADTDNDGKADVDVNKDGRIDSLDMAEGFEQKTLTMDMTHVESSECVSYNEATGEMKFHYVMDDGREINVIIQGTPATEYAPFSPKIVMTGGTGGITEEQLKTEPWKTASQYIYETPTSQYPLSYYVDGTLPGGNYAIYQNISLNTAVTPTEADYAKGMKYEYQFAADASCSFTLNVPEGASVTKTTNGDTVTVKVTVDGQSVTYTLTNVTEETIINIEGSEDITENTRGGVSPGATLTPHKFEPGTMKINPADIKITSIPINPAILAGANGTDEDTSEEGTAGV